MGPLPPASNMQVLINGRGKRTRKPRFSATLDFASKSSRPCFHNHLRNSMCAGLSQQSVCLWPRNTEAHADNGCAQFGELTSSRSET